MTTKTKAMPTDAVKRDLFAELSEGVGALAEARQGKRTQPTHAAEYRRGHQCDAARGQAAEARKTQ